MIIIKKIVVLLMIIMVITGTGCHLFYDEPVWGKEFIVTPEQGQEGIKAALREIVDLGRGRLVLLKGTYIVSTPIEIVSNMVFEGQGSENTIIKLADAFDDDIYMIKGDGVENVTICNLTVDGNRNNQINGDQRAIFFQNSQQVTIRNVHAKNCTSGAIVVHDGTKNFVIDNVVAETSLVGIAAATVEIEVINSILRENDQHGINVRGNNLRIYNNTIHNNGGSGLLLTSTSDSFVEHNNIFDNASLGIWRDSGIIVQSDSNNNSIMYNEIRCGEAENKHYYGILIITSQNNVVSNNDLYQSGTEAAIRELWSTTDYGDGNILNDGTWGVGPDYP